MWLLETSVRESIEKAECSEFTPSAAQFEAAQRGATPTLDVDGGEAVISVSGTLTKNPSFLAMYFGHGNTTYAGIAQALSNAEADPDVKEIVLAIDSPGGEISGMFEAIEAIRATSKPTRAVVHNTCASAAYALASQADSITANNKAARIGSIGIVATVPIDAGKISITSTNAPKKHPDVSTSEGRAVFVEELDAIHELFVEAISTGRGTTAEEINTSFGQGATFLAGEALKRGMIDAISETNTKTNPAQGGFSAENEAMDLKTFKSQHPDVYAEVLQEGVAKERDRVTAHLIMGETSGAIGTACAAIRDGEEMTAVLQATYMSAGMNRADISARQEDETSASAGDEASYENEEQRGSEVAALVEAQLGIEV